MRTVAQFPRKKSVPLTVDYGGAARLIGIHAADLLRMIRDGRFPVKPVLFIDGRDRWSTADVRKWVAEGCPVQMRPMAEVGK